jgi:hypothetical protein
MPGGRHHFEFVGKDPLVFRIIVTLLFINTFFFLSLSFGAKYFFPKASANLQPCEALTSDRIQYHAPGIVCWYASRSITIQFILLAMMSIIFIVFRKRVRYSRRD